MRQLAPHLEEWLSGYNRLVEKLEKNGFKPTSTNAREGLANLTYTLVGKKMTVDWVQDELVEGGEFAVPVRIYHPQPESQLPVLIYFHGGGHMAGSITVYDPICRKLARLTNHIVVSTDYRLAPECPYPAGITDCLNVLRNIWQVLDNRKVNYLKKLAIAGDSAGGAICATLSHTTQHDDEIAITKKILIYPSLDYTMESPSIDLNGEGYLLEKEKITWYFDNYFQGGEDRKELSPLYMEFTDKLPESLVITAEFCPLRDEGLNYIDKLQTAGVELQHLHFNDMIHAFMNMEDLLKEQCDTLYNKIADFLDDQN